MSQAAMLGLVACGGLANIREPMAATSANIFKMNPTALSAIFNIILCD
jgi:hypothetical protein